MSSRQHLFLTFILVIFQAIAMSCTKQPKKESQHPLSHWWAILHLISHIITHFRYVGFHRGHVVFIYSPIYHSLGSGHTSWNKVYILTYTVTRIARYDRGPFRYGGSLSVRSCVASLFNYMSLSKLWAIQFKLIIHAIIQLRLASTAR